MDSDRQPPIAGSVAPPPSAASADGTSGPAGAEVWDLARVMARFEAPLLRYVRQLIGAGGAEIEDVVQDTFLRFHREVSRHGTGRIVNLSSWLFRVAHNLAMDAGRRRRRRAALQASVMNDPVVNPVTAQAAAEPGAGLRREETLALAVRELQGLPEEQKTVLLLKILQGFTLQEISDITGMKIGTVNYRLTQGLRDLARRLQNAGAI